MRTQKPSGMNGWCAEAHKWMLIPSTYAGIILLFIAILLITLPEITSNVKDFLMVSFACVALLPGDVKI
jgi:hypothetical protein